VKAFPNAFLGVLMPEEELALAPKFKRGRRFDWLYEQVVTTGRLESLLSKGLDLPAMIWRIRPAIPVVDTIWRHKEKSSQLAIRLFGLEGPPRREARIIDFSTKSLRDSPFFV
jgi:hypothetical protein